MDAADHPSKPEIDAVEDETVDDDGIDLALAIAFAPVADTTCTPSTAALNTSSKPLPTKPSTWEAGTRLAGRYEVIGEIARGGMGVVLRVRDAEFDRDLAVKVLAESHGDNPAVAHRFWREAKISGQLQHPGIPPVYALGRLDDARPYFAMKLIAGRTLADLMTERGENDAGMHHGDRGRFVAIFEQVCQTLAYAHSRRIIHRDLKPANIMVGAFGEVQIMDWGLAKRVDETSAAQQSDGWTPTVSPTDTSVETPNLTVVASPLHTQSGAIMGTPAYMPPEQARGRVDELDERSDVFGLGAILCEILTGRPPFFAATYRETLWLASEGDLTAAFARLDASGADGELIALAKRCLGAYVEDRPRNAAEVATAVRAHLESVAARLRDADIAAARTAARIAEERKRRRLAFALAAVVFAAAAIGIATWQWIDAELAKQERTRLAQQARDRQEVTSLLAELPALRATAAAAPDDASAWRAVQQTLARAESIVASESFDGEIRQRTQSLRKEIDAQGNDRQFIARLEQLRGHRGPSVHAVRETGFVDFNLADAEFAAAFREYGVDVDKLPAAEAADQLKSRAIAPELAAALDDWALMRLSRNPAAKDWRPLLAVARLVDPSDVRNQLRDAVEHSDVRGLYKFIETSPAEGRSPKTALLLAGALAARQDVPTAVYVLRRAWRDHPGDFWISYQIVVYSHYVLFTRDSLPYARAAVALRPRSPIARMALAAVLTGEEEAVTVAREAIELGPNDYATHATLSRALIWRRRYQQAILAARRALELAPDQPWALWQLSDLLRWSGQREEALQHAEKLFELQPNESRSHAVLAMALGANGRLQQAIMHMEAATRIEPLNTEYHRDLGRLYARDGQWNKALVEHRAAIEKWPHDASLYGDLALALVAHGQWGDAGRTFVEMFVRGHREFHASYGRGDPPPQTP